MTAGSPVVLDASVLVRAVIEPRGAGAEWVASVDRGAVEGHTAALAFTETANALLVYVRADALSYADAVAALDVLGRVPLRVHGAELAPAALGMAHDLGLSAYDGTYAALADALDARLVTADRRLAAAVGDAELLA